MITKEMKVAQVLKEYPETLDVFVNASPHFGKLKNKILRKALAGRVSVEQAAAIGRVNLYELLFQLNKKANDYSGDEINFEKPAAEPVEEQEKVFEKPEFLLKVDKKKIKALDVRPIINSGKDPLAKILEHVKSLEEDDIFLLINSFEPVPLYTVLGNKGFDHFTEKKEDQFHVYFYKSGEENDSGSSIHKTTTGSIDLTKYSKTIEINVRELPPPEPMMKIFEVLPRVDDKTLLLVHHHREPLMLYSKLEERGYKATSNKIEENYYKVFITKKNDD